MHSNMLFVCLTKLCFSRNCVKWIAEFKNKEDVK